MTNFPVNVTVLAKRKPLPRTLCAIAFSDIHTYTDCLAAEAFVEMKLQELFIFYLLICLQLLLATRLEERAVGNEHPHLNDTLSQVDGENEFHSVRNSSAEIEQGADRHNDSEFEEFHDAITGDPYYDENQNLIIKVRLLEEKSKMLECQVKEASKEYLLLTESLMKSEAAKLELEAEDEQLKAENARLAGEVIQAFDDLTVVRSQFNEYKDIQETKINEMNSEILKLNGENQTLQKALAVLEHNVQEDLRKMQEEKENAIQHIKSSFNKEAVDKRMEELEETVKRLEAAKRAGSAKEKEILEKINLNYKKNMDSLNDNIATLTDERDELKAQLDVLSQEHQDLESERAKVLIELGQIKNQVNLEREEMKKQEVVIANLLTDKETLESEREIVKSKLQQIASDSLNHKTELIKKEKDLSDQQEQLKLMKERLDIETKMIKILQIQLTAERTQLNEEVAKLAKEQENFELAAEQLKKREKDLKWEDAQSKNLKENLSQEKVQLKNQEQDLQQRSKWLEDQEKQVQQEWLQVKKQKDDLKKLSEKLKGKNEELQLQDVQLKEQQVEIQRTAEQVKKQSKEVQQKIEQVKNQEKVLQEKNLQLNGKENELQQKNSRLNVKDNELQQKNSQLNMKEEQLQQNNSQLNVKEKVLQQKESLLNVKENELQQKNSQLNVKEKVLQQKESLLSDKENELQQKNLQLNMKEEQLQQKDSQLNDNKEQLHQKESQLNDNEEKLLEKNLQLNMKEEQLQQKFDKLVEIETYLTEAVKNPQQFKPVNPLPFRKQSYATPNPAGLRSSKCAWIFGLIFFVLFAFTLATVVIYSRSRNERKYGLEPVSGIRSTCNNLPFSI